jgi:hypothetical protein
MAKREPVAGKPIPGVEGAQTKRALGPFDGALGVTAPAEDGTSYKISEGGGGTKRKRRLESLGSSGTVVLIHPDDEPRECQRRAVVLAVRDCGVSVMNCGPAVLFP